MTASRPPRDDRGTRDLAPNNAVGAAYLLQCVAFTYGGFMLAESAGLFGWLSGQLLLAAAWPQWFVLLHEAGHHAHMPAGNSGGAAVQPVAAIDQEKYTRSFRMPEWAARYLLMNFNLHELHHMYVRIPGYALHKISRRTGGSVYR